ncbi:hypothetical protein K492DRAFT_143530 [Lichtheimia hyalospora FSU 10163]|nr:hypothetical protein K492DRAFT_143530 [Lichtheimia hyalospora FSU 10163]
MDLDSSLDDIIAKRGKTRPQSRSHSSQRRSTPLPRRPTLASSTRYNANDNGRSGRNTHHAIHPKSKTITKTSSASSILKRINPVPGGGFVTKKPISTSSLANRLGPKSTLQQSSSSGSSKLDPSQIVITKSTGRRGGNEDNAPRYGSPVARHDRREYGSSSSRLMETSPTMVTASHRQQQQQQQQPSSFNIRGLSGSGSGNGLSIRGEAGPSIVLISNLDPGANAEDVKTACSQFGRVYRTEVMLDASGRSFGEAEVEFASKAAALECIRKLDNEIADGRILRATLRDRPPAPIQQPPTRMHPHHPHPHHPPSPAPPMGHFATQTLRSVIAPTRSGYTSAASATGKLYSDQMMQQPPHHDYAQFPPPQSRRY